MIKVTSEIAKDFSSKTNGFELCNVNFNEISISNEKLVKVVMNGFRLQRLANKTESTISDKVNNVLPTSQNSVITNFNFKRNNIVDMEEKTNASIQILTRMFNYGLEALEQINQGQDPESYVNDLIHDWSSLDSNGQNTEIVRALRQLKESFVN